MPGVPPDAIDNVKRLLKGIFKRNKKQSKTTEAPPATQQPAASAPAQSSTTNAAPPAVDKPLPPTHPLATGQHDQPQEAIPQDHLAQPGPTPSTQDVKKVDGGGASSALPAAGAPEESVKENPPAPPPKNDGAFDAPKLDTSDHKENVPTTSSAPPSDSAIATPNTPAKPTDATDAPRLNPSSNVQPTEAKSSSAVEEKVPIHAESAIPKVNAASTSGMSATSGPLEDFPMASDDKE